MNSHQDAPELSLGKIDIPSILEKVILSGIVFILALPLLGDYGMWLFPVGRDVIFKLTVEFLLILSVAKSTFYNPSQPTLKVRGGMGGVITLSLVFFWLIMALATIFSIQQEFSIWGNIYKNQGLITWTHYLLFFFLLTLFMREKNRWDFLLHIAIFIGTLVSLVGLLQLTQNGFDSRPASTLNNSNYLASYLVLLLPLTFTFFLKKPSYFLLIASFLQFFALVGSQTRGGYLGIIIAGIIFYILHLAYIKKVSKPKLFLLTIPPLFVLLTAYYLILTTNTGQAFQQKLPDFTERLLNYQNVSGAGRPRFEAWKAGWNGMLERPLLGYGPENFFAAFDEHYSGSQDHTGSLAQEGSLWESWFDKAHNFIFDIGATMGFLGLFTYVTIFAAAVFVLLKNLRIMNNELRIMAIGFTAAFSGYLVQNLLGFDTIVPGIYMVFLLGYANFITNYNPSQPTLNVRGGAPPLKVRGGWGQLSSRIFLICVIPAAISLFIFSFTLHANILKANHQLNLGESLARNTGVEQAFVAFEKGLEYNASPINPNLRRRYAVIALAYYDAVEKRCRPSGDLLQEDNAKQCERLLADSKKYLSRALVLQQKNAALEWPRFTRNYIYAAQISHILGDYESSDLYFKKALELSPRRTSIQTEWNRLREQRNQ